MSNSSNRSKEYDTVHHITSRIAHKVRFLQEEAERNDLIEMIRRAAYFTGVKLLGWCIMINHFHILAFLPTPVEVDEKEILRRYVVLKGVKGAAALEEQLTKLRLEGETGCKEAERLLAVQRKRMYSIGEFVKIVKQWFSEEYNRRNSHTGTLWEGAYHDRVVAYCHKDIVECLGYIHLNPIRAAACATFDGYAWSSYSAFKKGDEVAIEGMRFVYSQKTEDGREPTLDEIAEMHEELLASLLEKWKLRRAEEIVLKRAAGYKMPDDPLTNEAILNQARVHLEEVRRASMDLRAQRDGEKSARLQRGNLMDEIKNLLTLRPGIDTIAMEQTLGVPRPSLYRYLRKMRTLGIVRQREHGQWESIK
ncbi:MAG: transposase [Kiritimatiellae bacterium]|nr:transposase [Kiritimatiellia bacterium]